MVEMEKWEYIKITFSSNEANLYIYPGDMIDGTRIKQVFKDRGEFQIYKEENVICLYFGDYPRSSSNLTLALNTLGLYGWEAFAVSDTEYNQSILLKRKIAA